MKFYQTHEEFISKKHYKEKRDIINFVSMNDDGISSERLESLYKKVAQGELELSSLTEIVKETKPSWDFIKRNTMEDIG